MWCNHLRFDLIPMLQAVNPGSKVTEFVPQGKEVFGFQPFSRIGNRGSKFLLKRFFQRRDGLVLRFKWRFHLFISGVGQSRHAPVLSGYRVERPVHEYGDVMFLGELQDGVLLSGIRRQQGS